MERVGSFGQLVLAAATPLILSATVLACGAFVALVYSIGKIPDGIIALAAILPMRFEAAIISAVAVGAAVPLFFLKTKHQLWYGIIEMAFAIACALSAAPKLLTADRTAWIQTAAAAYLCVRSLYNVVSGASKSKVFYWLKDIARLYFASMVAAFPLLLYLIADSWLSSARSLPENPEKSLRP